MGEILYLQEHIHGNQAMTVNWKNIFVVCRMWQCNLDFLINVCTCTVMGYSCPPQLTCREYTVSLPIFSLLSHTTSRSTSARTQPPTHTLHFLNKLDTFLFPQCYHRCRALEVPFFFQNAKGYVIIRVKVYVFRPVLLEQ